MRYRVLRLVTLATLVSRLVPTHLWSHSMYQAAVLLGFHGSTADLEVQLPAERVRSALQFPVDNETVKVHRKELTAYVLSRISATLPDGCPFRLANRGLPSLETVDSATYVVSHLQLLPPANADSILFDLHCDVLIDRIPLQVVLVSISFRLAEQHIRR